MSHIDTNTTVGQLVAERPNRARVFENLGIDYCCGGKRPLGEMCREQSLDVQAVVKQIEEMDARSGDGERRWTDQGLASMCDDIVATHHAYLRENLPRLEFLTGKVLAAHGANHPELAQVRETYLSLKAELEAHTAKEEMILFPMIRQLDTAEAAPQFHCGSVANPIRVMELEHDGAGKALEALRSLTEGYVAPDDACNTYRVMLDALAELEADTHRHVHKENSILFPRAVEREASLPAA